jgi:hypothetical protein
MEITATSQLQLHAQSHIRRSDIIDAKYDVYENFKHGASQPYAGAS